MCPACATEDASGTDERDDTSTGAALVVSGPTLAKAATARYDFLDLLQAAVVAEFEDGAE